MEGIFLSFSRSLPAATLLMLMVLLVTRSKSSAVRRHQWLGWGLGLAGVIPLVEPHLPQWRILPRVGNFTPAILGETFLFLAAAWLLGAAGMIARTFIGIASLHWRQRAAIPVDDEDMLAIVERCREHTGIQEAPEVFLQPVYAMPMTWGWLRPRIWLPLTCEDWSEHELECVLLHEMAHIERRDFPSEILNRICLAIYWFHPVAWMVSRRLELAREMACDDQVLLAGQPAAGYAESLAQIGAGLPVTLPTTAAGFLGRKPLITRMIGIADPWRARSRLTGEDVWATAAPVTLAALFVCSLGFKAAAEIHADQRPDPPAPKFPVVSVWDDVVVPARQALATETPSPRRVQTTSRPRASHLKTTFTPPTIAAAPPAIPIASDKPVRLARLAGPATTPRPLPRREQHPQPRQQSPQAFLVGLGVPRRTAAAPIPESAPILPAPETAVPPPDSNEAKQTISVAEIQNEVTTTPRTESPSVAGEKQNPLESTSAAEPSTQKNLEQPSPKIAEEPRRRRELGAAMQLNQGVRHVKIDCLVAKGTATKLLRAEISTDLKTWKPLAGANRITSHSVDTEHDRLILQIAANTGNGFIRLREMPAATPIPEKISPIKKRPISPPTPGRRNGRAHFPGTRKRSAR